MLSESESLLLTFSHSLIRQAFFKYVCIFKTESHQRQKHSTADLKLAYIYFWLVLVRQTLFRFPTTTVHCLTQFEWVTRGSQHWHWLYYVVRMRHLVRTSESTWYVSSSTMLFVRKKRSLYVDSETHTLPQLVANQTSLAWCTVIGWLLQVCNQSHLHRDQRWLDPFRGSFGDLHRYQRSLWCWENWSWHRHWDWWMCPFRFSQSHSDGNHWTPAFFVFVRILYRNSRFEGDSIKVGHSGATLFSLFRARCARNANVHWKLDLTRSHAACTFH